MTKERRLAIQMWEEIRAHIRDVSRPSLVNELFIQRIKTRFVIEHNLYWKHECWFCQYVRYRDYVHGEGCQRCPLSNGYSSTIVGETNGCANNAYYRVLHARMRKTKLKACDEIIRILNGRLK